MKKTLDGIKRLQDFEWEGKRVFVRLDLNVPMQGGKITDDTRINAALPTLKFLAENGAKVVIGSHLGRPKSDEDHNKFSMEPVARQLGQVLRKEIVLVEETRSEAPKALLAGLKDTQMIMLENLRFDKDETKNGTDLGKAIKQYTDIYVNDAFGVSHRSNASVDAMTKEYEKKGIGKLIEKEVTMLDHILHSPESPYLVVLGGAKVSDKISIIEDLIDKVDQFVIGGAMAYTFLAAQSVSTGKSLVEKDSLSFARELLERMKARGKEVLLPQDHVAVPELGQVDQMVVTQGVEIPADLMGVDIGPKTVQLYSAALQRAKTIFWNGPMGVFETPSFATGSFAVAKAMAECEGTTVVGGGDSAAAAWASGHGGKMSHISTGGGASLEYLQGAKLPGIESLRPLKRSEKGSEFE